MISLPPANSTLKETTMTSLPPADHGNPKRFTPEPGGGLDYNTLPPDAEERERAANEEFHREYEARYRASFARNALAAGIPLAHAPLRETMVAWNRHGDARSGPFPDRSGWSEGLQMTQGAPCMDARRARGARAAQYVTTLFVTLVIRDGVDPQVAHKALCGVTEYRQAISPDTAGAIE